MIPADSTIVHHDVCESIKCMINETCHEKGIKTTASCFVAIEKDVGTLEYVPHAQSATAFH